MRPTSLTRDAALEFKYGGSVDTSDCSSAGRRAEVSAAQPVEEGLWTPYLPSSLPRAMNK